MNVYVMQILTYTILYLVLFNIRQMMLALFFSSYGYSNNLNEIYFFEMLIIFSKFCLLKIFCWNVDNI